VTIRGLPLFGDHASYILMLVAPASWPVPVSNSVRIGTSGPARSRTPWYCSHRPSVLK
jgi:hypothetical protein